MSDLLLDRIVDLPPAFDTEAAARARADLREAAGENADAVDTLLNDGVGGPLVDGLTGNSPFLTRCLTRDASFVADLLTTPPEKILEDLLTPPPLDLPLDELTTRLRRHRRRVALLLAACDVGQVWPLETITRALSDLADWALQAGVRHFLLQAQPRDFELPHPDQPERDTGLIVLGMGKLGSHELNYSSDIDFVVFFDPDGLAYTGRHTLQHSFIRLTQGLVKLLQEPTADGYVFRTDLRLRPDPGVTPVAVSVEAAASYYESLGQNWERAAMIKSRACAGDIAAGEAFLAEMQAFIWRRNLDFASIEDVHSIKRQIHSHRGHDEIAIDGHNIKLGRGGIRDIEFFVQTQQLIAGGRDPSLRNPTTCGGLRARAEAKWIDEAAADELIAAYRYHRTVEHRLQMIHDEQTQTLPKDGDGIRHLACFMGQRDPDAFRAELRRHMEVVQRHYAALFEASAPLGDEGNLVFTGTEDDPDTLATLEKLGYGDPTAVATQVRGWHHGRYRCTRTSRARALLTELVPGLLRAFAATGDADATLRRFDKFLWGLPAGVQLFSLLHAHPNLLDLLARLMSGGPRLADYLARNAAVFDAVIGGDFFDDLPDQDELAKSLAGGLATARDYEEALDLARRFVKERRFQVGAQVLLGETDVDAAGAAYARLADVAIAAVFDATLNEFATGHGHIADSDFAVLGMGKLGGAEMNEASDLDLVMCYRLGDEHAKSDGERQLVGPHYFGRFSQRLINAITAPTAQGALYEVDMRLRPSGNKGPVVTRVDSFIEYQRNEAWTWEHMALTRLRFVAGPDAMRDRVETAVREILCRPRERAKIMADVVEMRARIADAKPTTDPWEMKQVRGGLVDQEFIAQALQLVHAHAHPQVLHPNTCEALAALAEAGVLDQAKADKLVAASRLMRGLLGVLRVAWDGAFVPAEAPAGLVRALCHEAGLDDLAAIEARLVAVQAEVKDLFEELVG